MKLTLQEIDRGMAATLKHGFGTFFPVPPELALSKKNWKTLRNFLASFDLDTYEGYAPIRSFAPKSRLSVRRVILLHPFDFILYTALVLKMKPGISKTRLPPDKVFSYRTEKTAAGELYSRDSSLKDFREAARNRLESHSHFCVGVTDIADFFPRIYHHRLVNALEASNAESVRPYLRVLEKMLSRFSEGTSYGLPVGPPASRVLVEAVLIDVDSTLVSFGIDFIRFVDDYLIFAATPSGVEYGIRILGETLFLHHGLTLQAAKTRVMTAAAYLEKYSIPVNEKEQNRRRLFEIISESLYENSSYDVLSEEEKTEIDSYNLVEMLQEALGEGENVDYQEVAFILGRLSSLQKPELISIVLENLERLYPVADAVSSFFKEFKSLSPEKYQEIGTLLLRPVLETSDVKPSDFYVIWALDVFASHEHWAHGDELLRIFREANSDAIRRYAALALAKSGSRPQVVAIKSYLNSAVSLSRTVMLLSTARLGTDERMFLKKSLRLNEPIEKICVESHI